MIAVLAGPGRSGACGRGHASDGSEWSGSMPCPEGDGESLGLRLSTAEGETYGGQSPAPPRGDRFRGAALSDSAPPGSAPHAAGPPRHRRPPPVELLRMAFSEGVARKEPSVQIGNHMVTDRGEDRLNGVFHALAHPARRAILARLSERELTVGELAEPFAMSRPAISKHLDVLARAGLVERIAAGRRNRCRLVGAPLADAAEWVLGYARFWSDQLDALERYFHDNPEEQ